MKVLITGKDSFIGRNLKEGLENTGEFTVDELDMENEQWQNYDFAPYDTVIHVAAIVHKKKKKIPWETYYQVNTILPYKVAKKARKSRVKQFIFFSSMAVYGQGKKLPFGNIIDEKTGLKPKNYYGKSKLEAEYRLQQLNSEDFKVSIVRPPNIYGYGCPGNYISSFVKLAKLTPVIPVVYTDSKQGFLYIENLCNFIYQIVTEKRSGIFHPQDGEGISTFTFLSEIAGMSNKKVCYSHVLGKVINYLSKIPIVIKVFGGVSYSSSLANYPYNNYSKVDLREALKKTIMGPGDIIKNKKNSGD
ncbi:NAD-dependent epimerase/dehydratase family protein [Herbinix luporum]|uniref:NAD-dependent epimerase/dehydratase domain-containing protein n=1 Tax=Herbinix luporum TaxID=1679721 RepID=A0A0K8J5A0_9FIRM|nr:NAD-dependent epimerase/dehydratase family protein [Herbinix luporum]CUH92846.1 hypothetical protein SD1D_1300 [Herbinix luporum]